MSRLDVENFAMETYNKSPSLTDLSHELICNILQYLPVREVLAVGVLCRKLSIAVSMHFRLCKSIDFCPHSVDDYMPSSITDDHLHALFKKCPLLEVVYGLHPWKIERRRLRRRSALTVPGVIDALSLCFNLKGIETCDLRLLEAVLQHLPQIEIIGHFQNRDYMFPPHASQKLKLQPYTQITSLHLIGVEVPELTAMPHLRHLHLQCVRFTKLQPFRAFLAQNLRSFVMKSCFGPSMSLSYLSLIIALSTAVSLNHLELVRVPLPGGLFQRAVEDAHESRGFCNLRTLVVSGCKGILEVDIGHLMIVASKKLETLYIQPSLTKDSLFVSLSYAQCSFPSLRNLHLGYIDSFNYTGEWSNEALVLMGLAEVPDTPSSITDSGMKVIGQLLPYIKSLSVSNCPHLMTMFDWMPGPNESGWSALTDLTLQKCHCLQLSSFSIFVSMLQSIEVIILYEMFKEPPKGCSHVGLSAGTGLGMSSAVVSNQDEHLAVQGHPVQDFDHPMEEEAEVEVEIVDPDIEENQEPHFMVLRGDFFEEDDDADYMEYENRCINEAVLNQRDGYFSDDSSEFDDDENHPLKAYHDRANQQPGSEGLALINQPESHRTHAETSIKSAEMPISGSSDSIGQSSRNPDPVPVYDPHQPSTSKAGMHLECPYSEHSSSLEREKIGLCKASEKPPASQNRKCPKSVKPTNRGKEKQTAAVGTSSRKGLARECRIQSSYASRGNQDVDIKPCIIPVSKSAENHSMDISESSSNVISSNIKAESRMSTRRKINPKTAIKSEEEKSNACHDESTSRCELSSKNNIPFPKGCSNNGQKSTDVSSKPCAIVEKNEQNYVSDEVSELDPKFCLIDCAEGGNHSPSSVKGKSKAKSVSSNNKCADSNDHRSLQREKCVIQKVEPREGRAGKATRYNCHSKVATTSDSLTRIVKLENQNKVKEPEHSDDDLTTGNLSGTTSSSNQAELKVDPLAEQVRDSDVKRDSCEIVPCCVVLNRIVNDVSDEAHVVMPENKAVTDPAKPSSSMAHDPNVKLAVKRTSDRPSNQASKCQKTSCNTSSDSSVVDSDCSLTVKKCFVPVKRCQSDAPSHPELEMDELKSFTGVIPRNQSRVCCPLDPNVPSTSKSVCIHSKKDSNPPDGDQSNYKDSKTPRCSLRSSKDVPYGKHSAHKTRASRNSSQKICALDNLKTPKSGPEHSNSLERIEKSREKIRISSDDASLLSQNEHSYLDKNFELIPCSGTHFNIKVDPKSGDQSASKCELCSLEAKKRDSKKKVAKKGRKSKGKKNSGLRFSRKKSSSKSRDLKKNSVSSVVTFVSQGTQANSADIRRSVRRIRKVAVRAKKVTSTQAGSFKSSKISARREVKKSVDNHRPETSDKATSTSDPLLEDDAVQVLKVTSTSLLSFTIIACGISDLIIETCPKLFHLEAQACRILKRLCLNSCSDLQRFNVSQCPKLTIHELAMSVLSIYNPESYLLVSYEPCMQNYHPGEGEGVILSHLPKEETAVICHDFQEFSNECIQASMKDKMMGWLQYLSTAYATLNFTFDSEKQQPFCSCKKSTHYPYDHDIRRLHGEYMFSLKSEFCHALGHYQVLSNNPLFLEAFESHWLDKEFPAFSDCEATRNYNLYTCEAQEKHLMMNGVVGFYIPVTEFNRIETYKLTVSEG